MGDTMEWEDDDVQIIEDKQELAPCSIPIKNLKFKKRKNRKRYFTCPKHRNVSCKCFDQESINLPVHKEEVEQPNVNILNVQITVVLDTNILLDPFGYMLCDYFSLVVPEVSNIKSQTEITFLIPWIVMQELNSIKENKGVKRSQKLVTDARNIISLLFKIMNKHKFPKILNTSPFNVGVFFRGQSSAESEKRTKISFVAECEDDSILQCCLSHTSTDGLPDYDDVEKKLNTVILLTNDKGLGIKALSSNIPVFESKEIGEKASLSFAKLHKWDTNTFLRILDVLSRNGYNTLTHKFDSMPDLKERLPLDFRSMSDGALALRAKIEGGTPVKTDLRLINNAISKANQNNMYGFPQQNMASLPPSLGNEPRNHQPSSFPTATATSKGTPPNRSSGKRSKNSPKGATVPQAPPGDAVNCSSENVAQTEVITISDDDDPDGEKNGTPEITSNPDSKPLGQAGKRGSEIFYTDAAYCFQIPPFVPPKLEISSNQGILRVEGKVGTVSRAKVNQPGTVSSETQPVSSSKVPSTQKASCTSSEIYYQQHPQYDLSILTKIKSASCPSLESKTPTSSDDPKTKSLTCLVTFMERQTVLALSEYLIHCYLYSYGPLWNRIISKPQHPWRNAAQIFTSVQRNWETCFRIFLNPHHRTVFNNLAHHLRDAKTNPLIVNVRAYSVTLTHLLNNLIKGSMNPPPTSSCTNGPGTESNNEDRSPVGARKRSSNPIYSETLYNIRQRLNASLNIIRSI